MPATRWQLAGGELISAGDTDLPSVTDRLRGAHRRERKRLRPGATRVRLRRPKALSPSQPKAKERGKPRQRRRGCVLFLDVAQAEVLDLDVVVHAVVRALAAQAGLLHAAEGHVFGGQDDRK